MVSAWGMSVEVTAYSSWRVSCHEGNEMAIWTLCLFLSLVSPERHLPNPRPHGMPNCLLPVLILCVLRLKPWQGCSASYIFTQPLWSCFSSLFCLCPCQLHRNRPLLECAVPFCEVFSSLTWPSVSRSYFPGVCSKIPMGEVAVLPLPLSVLPRALLMLTKHSATEECL